jgi:hypothetical protein
MQIELPRRSKIAEALYDLIKVTLSTLEIEVDEFELSPPEIARIFEELRIITDRIESEQKKDG